MQYGGAVQQCAARCEVAAENEGPQAGVGEGVEDKRVLVMSIHMSIHTSIHISIHMSIRMYVYTHVYTHIYA